MTVHNHGPAEDQGLDCGERRVADGTLRGYCLDAPALTELATAIETFKDAWHHADDQGAKGLRVEAGLRATLLPVLHERDALRQELTASRAPLAAALEVYEGTIGFLPPSLQNDTAARVTVAQEVARVIANQYAATVYAHLLSS